jgi:hypothetical protein
MDIRRQIPELCIELVPDPIERLAMTDRRPPSEVRHIHGDHLASFDPHEGGGFRPQARIQAQETAGEAELVRALGEIRSDGIAEESSLVDLNDR